MVWSLLGNLSIHLIGFVVGIQLARILSPDDYGMVGMLGIFTAIAGCVIECGMSNALVRKSNRTEADCSTVFYFSVATALLMYIALFIAAPHIASFYNQPELCNLTRVLSLTLIIGALAGVHNTKLTINLQFKRISAISITTAIIGGIVGLSFAYSGWGVWSLAYMQLATYIARVILTWIIVRWVPQRIFSWQSFRELFGFGSKLLAAAIIDQTYNNIRPLLIGKVYSGADLGYYAKANQYASLPATTTTNLIAGVTYPILCKLQQNDDILRDKYRLLIRLSAFVVFPLLVGLASVAKPAIVVLITEKWLPCASLLQILCFALMLNPIHVLNLNLLQVKGRADIFLKLEIIKKILGVIMLIITVPISVPYMCYGAVLISFISLFLQTYYTSKLIKVTFFKQMGDLLPSLLLSIIMGIIVWGVITFLPLSHIFQLAIGIPIGIVVYLGLALLLRMPELRTALQIIRNNLKK
ncbi:MAG: lipopolysaccharide biosynthesis protein [Akkermansia sp.]|nr:lipopolysaccharide biosynthesis protein [Akkermansia sp.]